jgi:hypothetical protein
LFNHALNLQVGHHGATLDSGLGTCLNSATSGNRLKSFWATHGF